MPDDQQPVQVSAPRPYVRRPWRVGPFSLRQVTVAIGVIAIVGALLTIATAPLGKVGPGLPVPEPSAVVFRSPVPGLDIGSLAPELAGTTGDGKTFQLVDLDGSPVRLADLRGKVVWLNFWASWCPPCQSETPLLRTMDQTYRDRGLALVGVQVQQTVDDGRRYVATYSLKYRIGADVSGDVFREYRVFALPTQFFIDTNGLVRAIVNGPMTDASARQLIEGLLPAGANPSTSPGSAP
jgi:cytochrome c biogenesis protein CcmG/thiol:disulfide interchange protein DsbE